MSEGKSSSSRSGIAKASSRRKRATKKTSSKPMAKAPPVSTDDDKYMVLWDFSVGKIHGLRGHVVEIRDRDLARKLKENDPKLIRNLGSLA